MMAEASKSIFTQRATAKLRTPDDLEKYVRVTNPSVWVVLVACMVLLAGLLAWGVFGAVSTSVSTTGVVVKGTPICFLSTKEVSTVHVGDATNFGGVQMTVAKVTPVPSSREEAKEVLHSDYLVSTLLQDDWAYSVYFAGDASALPKDVPQSVRITTERIAPISLVLGDQE